MIIFICGVPASGKSSFGNLLKDKYEYFYIDMEHSPWPDEKIHSAWDLIFANFGNEAIIKDFLILLKTKGDRIILDLGFVPNEIYFHIISTLKKFECRIIWFNCPFDIAKKRYLDRKTSPPMELFELQMERIKENWSMIISKIEPEIVEVVDKNRRDKTKKQIYEEIFKC